MEKEEKKKSIGGEKRGRESFGGHAVDGCCEFIAAGEEGTLEAVICAAWRIQNSRIQILIPPSCFCVVVLHESDSLMLVMEPTSEFFLAMMRL
ncbi:ZF-HD protein dimerization region protein [Medicago truncatula]|uniref:ZF-HD protein dimerization region protein n=1 Tax=Medicago truncatula TaxID=3880 RepID=A2Q482_MEDTR|nr:hypothetical protein MtrDRAFT_AC157375g6v1 [Medicago truncatula]AES63351.1 ZF-HD protein dimerization region protein [Medicago truncatula]